MKWSKYNLLYNNSKGESFLCNTRNLMMIKLNNGFYHQLMAIEEGKLNIDSLLPDELEYLKKNKIIVNECDDQNFVEQLKYLKYSKVFQNDRLSLVITPTLLCNFACPYCYESDLDKKSMSEETQNKIIDFINSYEGICKDLQITWHGGEPLVAFTVIKSLLKKIAEKSKLPLVSHQMVSNGYLFDDNTCDFFKETKLEHLQITIDGTEENHNKSRIHKSGVPTYEKIVKNIDAITAKMPNCRVAIRVNVHNDNKEDYPAVYKNLMQRWAGKNCYVYHAFVKDNESCKVTCCSLKEKAKFIINLKRNHCIEQTPEIAPKFKSGACAASFKNTFVIDSMGLLYKCWVQVGNKNSSIGSVYEKKIEQNIVAEFIVGADKFEDEKCIQCKLFPVCGGGCSINRIESRRKGTIYDACPLDTNDWGEYLDTFFKKQKTAAVNI